MRHFLFTGFLLLSMSAAQAAQGDLLRMVCKDSLTRLNDGTELEDRLFVVTQNTDTGIDPDNIQKPFEKWKSAPATLKVYYGLGDKFWAHKKTKQEHPDFLQNTDFTMDVSEFLKKHQNEASKVETFPYGRLGREGISVAHQMRETSGGELKMALVMSSGTGAAGWRDYRTNADPGWPTDCMEPYIIRTQEPDGEYPEDYVTQHLKVYESLSLD